MDLRLLNLTWRFYLTHHLVRFTDVTKHGLTDSVIICRAENSWFHTRRERSCSFMNSAASSITVVDIMMVLHVERRQDEGFIIILLIKIRCSDIVKLTYSRLICLNKLVLLLQRDQDVVADAILSKVD